MNEGQIKVIYIAGPARSGSTVLSNILGEIDGFFNAGEIIEIWDRGIVEDGLCGCGVNMSKCEVWSAVIEKTMKSSNRINVQEMIDFRDNVSHSSYVLWRMLIPGVRAKLQSSLKTCLSNLKEFYQEIKSTTRSKVIIDSSKNLGYVDMLAIMPDVDLYIIHLIRDPRATAYSWLRKKDGLRQINSIGSSLVWDVRNIATEMFKIKWSGKFLKLYYEDFIAKPRETVESILDLVHENPVHLPFVAEHKVKLGINHSIYGNPDRFKAGEFTLQLDEEWKTKMNVLHKIIVTALTWPLLLKYRYSMKWVMNQ